MSSIFRGAAHTIRQLNWKSSGCIHLLSSRASHSPQTLMINKIIMVTRLFSTGILDIDRKGLCLKGRFSEGCVKRQRPWILPGALCLHLGRGVPPLPITWHKWKGTHMDEFGWVSWGIFISGQSFNKKEMYPMYYSGSWISSLSSETRKTDTNIPLATEIIWAHQKYLLTFKEAQGCIKVA